VKLHQGFIVRNRYCSLCHLKQDQKAACIWPPWQFSALFLQGNRAESCRNLAVCRKAGVDQITYSAEVWLNSEGLRGTLGGRCLAKSP
jgi:hypothetical protein